MNMRSPARFILCVVAVLVCSVQGACLRADSREVRVGFILPLSGEWAFLGNGIRDGALLAQQDVQARGGRVRLFFEDNRGELALSAVLASKLIGTEKVDALVSIISGVGKVLKPMAEKARVLSIGICSDSDAADGRYSFINYLTAEQGTAKYIEHFSRVFGAHASLGVFMLNEAGFQRIGAELQRKAGGALEVRFVESFDKGTTDFRPLLLKVKAARPDALLVLGLSPEIETLVRQARSLGLMLPVTSIEGFGLASDKRPFEGAWFVDSAAPAAPFRDRFAAVYGRDLTPGVGHAYDSVMLIAHAFAGAPHRAAFSERFRRIGGFPGIVGRLRVRPDGVIWSEASLKVIKNGKAQELAE